MVDCPAGQSVTADTAGRCCWPNQVWAASRNVCVGVPLCPEGFAAYGETCVAAHPTVAPEPPLAYATGTLPATAAALPTSAAPPQPLHPPAALGNSTGAVRAGRAPPLIQSHSDAGQQVADLQARLTEVRQQHAGISFGGEIVALVVGIPTMFIGGWLLSSGPDFWSVFLLTDGIVLTLAGAIGLPVKASRKGALSRQVRNLERELQALEHRAALLPVRPSLDFTDMVFAIASPRFRF